MSQTDTIVERAVAARTTPAPGVLLDPRVLEDEVHRTRVGGLVALLLILPVMAGAALYGTDGSPAGRLLGGALVAGTALNAALLVVALTRRYGDLVSAGFGVVIVLLALSTCVYLGPTSCAVGALPSVIFYFGLGDSAVRRRAVSTTALVGYVAILVLAVAGILPRDGAHEGTSLEPARATAVLGGIVSAVLALTHWLARRTRRATLLAMSALEHARRRIAERDALLEEARVDLERALEVGRVGRYTGRDLGAYRLRQVIGRGAMGEVYRAIELESGQAVAIKVLHPHLAEDPELVQRFFREAEITGALRSPHIPTVLGSGTGADGSPWLAMELLVGSDLASDLRSRRQLPPDELDELVDHVARALDAAHAAGVVHRDVKPQNLFRTAGPQSLWKVLDFGVSKIVRSGATQTQGGMIGTPAYMSPEQIGAGEVDARTDAFALGAVVYRALTGRPAFHGPTEVATMHRVLYGQPTRPGELASVHADVDAVLAIALAKDGRRRFPSTAALARAWHDARAGSLPPALRDSAEEILAERPWGTVRVPAEEQAPGRAP